ncbi:hypothetical protein NFI96_029418, partial [Prochilodus magdalenae]
NERWAGVARTGFDATPGQPPCDFPIKSWGRTPNAALAYLCTCRNYGLVSLHLHPYCTICKNCVGVFKVYGMDYHRTPLGTSTTPCRDILRDTTSVVSCSTGLQDIWLMRNDFTFEFSTTHNAKRGLHRELIISQLPQDITDEIAAAFSQLASKVFL